MMQNPDKGVALDPKQAIHIPTALKLLDAYRRYYELNLGSSMEYVPPETSAIEAEIARLESELTKHSVPASDKVLD